VFRLYTNLYNIYTLCRRHILRDSGEFRGFGLFVKFPRSYTCPNVNYIISLYRAFCVTKCLKILTQDHVYAMAERNTYKTSLMGTYPHRNNRQLIKHIERINILIIRLLLYICVCVYVCEGVCVCVLIVFSCNHWN